MKKFLSMLAIVSLITSFIACDDDEEVFDLPTIQIVNTTLEQRAGEMIEVDASVVADAGIKTITVSVDGGDDQDVTGSLANQKAGIVTYEFEVPGDAAEGDTYSVNFTVTDNKNRTTTSTTAATITVAEEPAQTIELNESADGVGTTTWLARNTYVLNGKIYVNDGQTLTIEAGTVIKGQTGQAEAASALIVARGGKIMANGTSSNPIIFTSLADDLTRTDDLPKNQRGLWGGVILLGNAYINHANGQTNIEGIVASETNPRSLYGVGANPGVGGKNWALDNAHNAGELSYISIRHGGTNIGAGNEINGLTMGGVGTGTKIHHIEVYGNDDDGFEWFGGTVNTSYLASIYNQDDSYDWDFGWRAENQFWVAVQEQGFGDSNRGFESDGAHNGNLTAAIFSKPQIFNMTLVGSTASGTANADDHNAMFFTENGGVLIHNSMIMGFGQGVNITPNNEDRFAAGDLAFKNNIWTNVADNTTAGIANSFAEFQTYLEEPANGNEISDAPGISLTTTQFTLVPSAGSLALTKSRSALPAANGFTYETANFIGAFGTTNWMKGWTAADAYGFLP
ncbi:MAG: hypothetical protein WD824_06050 [Cyclobacteriaceae bacterium]